MGVLSVRIILDENWPTNPLPDEEIVDRKIEEGIELGIQRFVEAVSDDAKYNLSQVSIDSIRPTTWTGALENSITYTRSSHKEWDIIVDMPYADTVERGSKEFHFYPFYDRSGNLTNLGLWAIDKMGYRSPLLARSGFGGKGAHKYLLSPLGDKERGMNVSKPHPFFFKAVDDNFERIEEFIFGAIEDVFSS